MRGSVKMRMFRESLIEKQECRHSPIITHCLWPFPLSPFGQHYERSTLRFPFLCAVHQVVDFWFSAPGLLEFCAPCGLRFWFANLYRNLVECVPHQNKFLGF